MSSVNMETIFSKLNNENKYYKNLSDYIDKMSNEILWDEIWIWGLLIQLIPIEGISSFNNLTVEETSYLLKEICLQVVKKGGKLVDNNLHENREHHQFEEKMKKGDLSYIDDLVDFLIKNPHYGEDWGGFWFL